MSVSPSMIEYCEFYCEFFYLNERVHSPVLMNISIQSIATKGGGEARKFALGFRYELVLNTYVAPFWLQAPILFGSE